MFYDNKSLQELIRVAQRQQEIINKYRIPDWSKMLPYESINSLFTTIQSIDNSGLKRLIKAGTYNLRLAKNFENPDWSKAVDSLYGINRSDYEQTNHLFKQFLSKNNQAIEIIQQSISSIRNPDLAELNRMLTTSRPLGQEVFNLIQTCEDIGIDPKLYEDLPINVFHSLLNEQNICDYKDILTQFNSTVEETPIDQVKHKSKVTINDLYTLFGLILLLIQIIESSVSIYIQTSPQEREIDTEQLKTVLIQAFEDAQNEINESQGQQCTQPQRDICKTGRDKPQTNQQVSTQDKCQIQPTESVDDQLPQSDTSEQITNDMDQRAKNENDTGEK